jgi:intracellular multiplication protein IcmV
MAIRDVFKVSRKTFFNPRAWLGYDSIKDQTRTISSFIKDAATVQQPEHKETFEQALQRLNLNEETIKVAARNYYYYALFFLALAILDFLYGFYLLFSEGSILGFILALAVCALLLAQAFRNHFWYFQIKSRRLGCTFQEWRDAIMGKTSW